jgi:hypothetical protein
MTKATQSTTTSRRALLAGAPAAVALAAGTASAPIVPHFAQTMRETNPGPPRRYVQPFCATCSPMSGIFPLSIDAARI